ncbi:MAG: phosphoribosylformylglycinamidine cyclo-ligase [Deltaproteobacteria bacterium]|nr:phosphoribosylformylglycinamidine cyclo-ligase [Deltaproteobacteria bacterium]
MTTTEYKKAGVDIEKAEKFVKSIKIKNPSIFPFNISKNASPVLITATDGVGTKIQVAQMAGKHNTIGIDLVAMCVNDIIRYGANPLVFSNYISANRLNIKIAKQIIKGIKQGCKQAQTTLIGGETAEMPNHYQNNGYDLAGFAAGAADKAEIIDGLQIKAGDQIVGIASSGLHSNGYSLARKICFDILKLKIDTYIPELSKTIGEELLIPTKIYVKTLKTILAKNKINGCAHITGGGIIRNLAKIIPQRYKAVIRKKTWDIPFIFNYLKKNGKITNNEMPNVFNNGIGFILISSKNQLDDILTNIYKANNKAYLIGEISNKKNGENAVAMI